MPTHVGPNISGEENLVFGFDLSDQKNSYLGEPTTNYFASFGVAMPNLSGANVTTTLPDGTTGTVFRVTVNSNSNTSRCSMGINLPNQIPQANVSYTISHWIRTTGTVPVAAGWEAEVSFPDGYARPSFESGYIGDYGSLVQPNNISSTWQRVSYTYSYSTTKTSNITPFIYFGSPIGGTQDTIGATIDFYGFQFEVNSHSTPYTSSSRSVTQGLIDVTGNETINLTTVSFDSNAQMVFDGTDDYLNVNTSLNSGNFTYETVMSVNDTTYPIFGAGYGTAGTTIQSYITSSGALINLFAPIGAGGWVYGSYSNLNGYVSVANRLRHIVVTNNNTVWQTYVDGYLVGNVTFYQPTTGTDVGIGRIAMQSPSNLSTVVKMVKLYNRVLTSTEVLNNYNNIKRKYGI
jgi:hypothetical protein